MARGVGPNLGSRRRPDKREPTNRGLARHPRRLDNAREATRGSGLVAHLAGELGEEAALGRRQALDPLGGDLVEDAVDFRLRGVALGAPRLRRRVAPADHAKASITPYTPAEAPTMWSTGRSSIRGKDSAAPPSPHSR